MFRLLQKTIARPKPFEFYTAAELWTDPHIASEMLKYHLDDSTELASRNSKFIDRSVAWMIERFDINDHTRICDLGCGPGLYASRLAKHGASVTGVDFSAHSLEYARKEAADAGLPIKYVCSNYLEGTPPGPFDLVTLIYCDFCALSPEQRHRLLSQIRSSLAPEGHLFFDACSVRLFEESEESTRVEKYPEGGFWTSEPHYVIVSVFKYSETRVLLHKHVVIEEGRTREIYNWIQCYDPSSLENELVSNGFEVCEYFGNVAGDLWQDLSKEIAAVARPKA